ncbi:hypothetical protein XENTR_v10009759 [Xenopus tropicalis]|nr:hypothetical protein XENTR_v10009759 [Xenopus tropicalis]
MPLKYLPGATVTIGGGGHSNISSQAECYVQMSGYIRFPGWTTNIFAIKPGPHACVANFSPWLFCHRKCLLLGLASMFKADLFLETAKYIEGL